MENNQNKLAIALKGAAMGMAEVIPGVSGGTIAFITGIYETLINSIKAVLSPDIFGVLKNEGLAGAWRHINGPFLLPLGIGMVSGIITGVLGISHLLEHFPTVVWGLFFGLIVASVPFIGSKVTKWDVGSIVAFLTATALAAFISLANPTQGSDSLLFVFISGAIAISALVLPGISGSFILLLMGMYTVVFSAASDLIKTQDLDSLLILGVFSLGCLVGLGLFSRFLSWLFEHHKNKTLALLTGFLVGSLLKIWPWRNVVQTRVNSKGEEVPFIESNVLPAAYEGEPMTIAVIIAMVAGMILVGLMAKAEK